MVDANLMMSPTAFGREPLWAQMWWRRMNKMELFRQRIFSAAKVGVGEAVAKLV